MWIGAVSAAAQGSISVQEAQNILDRLARVESENRRLTEEIEELKRELLAGRATAAQAALAPDSPTEGKLEEQLEIQKTRTAELDQKKVEASQKMPLQLTGMLLFNAFENGKNAGSSLPDPVTASSSDGHRFSGATFRQTTLGLRYSGPQLPGGGTVDGSVYMDFFGGTFAPGNNLLRLRLATLDLNWKNTTITVGQDKPIIVPREPVSLAQVGVSPLTGAGNLWDWEPPARIEQRFNAGERLQVRAQGGVFMSNESAAQVAAPYASTLELWRPAFEGRLEVAYAAGTKRFEIAPGYHASSSHVIGRSVDSRVASLDWLIRPSSWWDFTGAWFTGQNFAGLGSLRQGFTIVSPQSVIPVHGYGAWGQLGFTASRRLTFHAFAGEENDRAKDLAGNAISRNLLYGANAIYKLAPNVLASFELSQVRTTYLLSGFRLNNHYDLALAYLF